MRTNEIMKEAESLGGELLLERRYLHRTAEVGFELPKTQRFVMDRLKAIGCEGQPLGRCGVRAEIGDGKRTVLLRADMDALPIPEKTDLIFRATNGNMHACGHDMHTAMLLGATRILKNHESELQGRVRLMLQPAEEILAGARDMIENGILNAPRPQAALMIHLTLGGMESGKVVIPEGVSAPAASFFRIAVKGEGSHGATPEKSRDALLAAAHIYSALASVAAREIASRSRLTVGRLSGGCAANAIADEAVIEGTVRSYSEVEKKRLGERINEVCLGVAIAMKVGVRVEFFADCPPLICDEELSRAVLANTKELLGDSVISAKDLPPTESGGGSEDFAYISREIPSLMIAMSAGERGALHSPEAIFNESVLARGSAILAYNAYKLLSGKR
ncbi:MAG: amidohydrolase [Clostridia bacterium]|nr:amidohydrolase [Clostridia bacterium]